MDFGRGRKRNNDKNICFILKIAFNRLWLYTKKLMAIREECVLKYFPVSDVFAFALSTFGSWKN